MTALTHAAATVDELLLSAALDVERFLAEIRRLNSDDDAWRGSIAEKCKALNERLSSLSSRLENRMQGARTAIAELRSTLTEYREDVANGAEFPSLREFQVAIGERYESLVETLRSRRIATPAELARAMEAEALENRRPKLKRAIFHILMGLGCVGLYQFVVDKPVALALELSFVAFFGGVELLRRYSKRINDFWTDRVFGGLGRPQERYRVNSASYYLWGITLVTLAAPKTVVCAALLVLAFGDPIASAVGYRVGLLRFKNGKSLGGTLAFFIAASLIVALYLGFFGGMSVAIWVGLTACMALSGALAELLNGKLDDNLVIPVVSAGAGMLFIYAVG